jgi:preprotein translocase subunit YajC
VGYDDEKKLVMMNDPWDRFLSFRQQQQQQQQQQHIASILKFG